ncbi:pyridine nucleotide-disulfide oxidoreductase [Salmonella bongori]|nr:pyridine nucleotide-disulfide oxidoreductase [Salmonella bongori]
MTQYQALIIGFGKAGKTLAATLAKTGWRGGDYRTVTQYVRRNLYQYRLYSYKNAGA